MTVDLYGIPNCDTVKKARRWLDEAGRAYTFHDYKKEGVDRGRLSDWADRVGWETLLNTRGTTFRKLPETDRNGLDRAQALALMAEHPSLIRRPVVEHGEGASDGLLVGFDADRWARELA